MFIVFCTLYTTAVKFVFFVRCYLRVKNHVKYIFTHMQTLYKAQSSPSVHRSPCLRTEVGGLCRFEYIFVYHLRMF